MKKIIALLVVSILILGILAACGKDDGGGTAATPTPNSGSTATAAPEPPTENQSEGQLLAEQYGLPYTPLSEAAPIEFTYFIRDPGTPPASTNPVIGAIETITNTKIEWEYLVGDLETKTSVMLASGDWHDFAYFGGEARPFIDSGLCLPLQDLMDQHAPNLRKHFSPWWELMTHTDGNIYVAETYGTPIGKENINEFNGTAFWLQKAVLDHFGRAPKTVDEYFDFIREYKDLYPTIDGVPTIGYEIEVDGWRNFGRNNPAFFLAGYGNWGGAMPDNQLAFDSVSTVSPRWTADFAKRWFQKLNDEFHLGTINAESLTRSHDDYLATLASGAVLGINDQGWNFMYSGLDPLRAENRHERTYLPLDLTYDDSIVPKYMDARSFTGTNGLIVNKNISDPVRAIQFMDYLILEPVNRFLSWGIEGTHWFFNDEGRIERPQSERDAQVETKYQDDNLGRVMYNQFPKWQNSFSDGNACVSSEQPEEYFAALVPYDKELFAKLGIKNQTGLMRGEPATWPVYYPYWSMAFEDGSPEQLADARVDDVRNRYLSRLIICPANEFESLWDEFVAAIDGTGERDLLDGFERVSHERFNAVFG